MLDTALVLLARNAIAAIDADLDRRRGGRRPAGRATHRDDVVMGRTLMQQALPTTFGLKAAGWTDRARRRPAAGWPRSWRALPVQYGGAVGTLAARSRARASRCGRRSPRSSAWPTPPLAWHTVRLPIADLAGALGAAAGVVATVALDVVLLAQTEVGEVAEVQRRPRRLVGDAAQEQPGRRDLRPGLRPARARPGGHPARRRWSRSTSAPPAPGTASGRR